MKKGSNKIDLTSRLNKYIVTLNNMEKNNSIKESNMDELVKSLKEIQTDQKKVQNDLYKLNQKERELKIEIFIRNTGLKVGVKVVYKDKAGIISRHSNKWMDVKPVIKFFKKDGTLGEREQEIYSWDMVKLQIVEPES